jgi:outer membrane immunogenic protein
MFQDRLFRWLDGAAVAAACLIVADTAAAAPPPSPAASWSGFYLGLGVGERTSTIDTSVSAATFFNPAESLVGPLFCTPTLPCIPGEPLDNASFRISPYLGYNWQLAPSWTVGIEGDWAWANAGRTISDLMAPGGNFLLAPGSGDNSYSISTKWDASLRGRVGFVPMASLPVLLYATGGVAWLNAQQTAVCGTLAAFNSACGAGSYAPSVMTDNTTRTGWTIGGGIESMLWGQWILRGEYRYADFGTWSPTDIRPIPGAPTFQLADTDAVHIRTQTMTFGVAYKFGDAAVAPRIAAPAMQDAATSWSGFYIGAGVGERTSDVNASVSAAALLPTFILVPPNLLSLCTAATPCAPSEPLDSASFRFSPYIGYNWQFAAPWLAGLEGDWGFAKGSRTLSGMMAPGGNGWFATGGNGLNPGTGDNSYSVATKWDASIRARLGYIPQTVIPALLYATGGVAWLNVQQTSVCGTVAISSDCYAAVFGATPSATTETTTRTGWTLGGGMEAMPWDHWILRAEYRYSDFGTWSPTDVRQTTIGTFNVTNAIRVHTQTAAFGLGYKF